MTEKVILFDFDGTIADSLDAIVNITNSLAGEFGYKPASQEQIAQLQNLPPRELIKESGISIFKIPFLFRRVKLELSKEVQYLSPIPGMKEALIELKNQGNRLGIITSNSQENVMAFLFKNELQNLFEFIYSAKTLFGKNKVITNFLRQESLKFEDVIYVGDETRDIEAARKSNIKVIAVSWGFNSREVLAEKKPDFLIYKPNELIDVIGSLQQVSISR